MRDNGLIIHPLCPFVKHKCLWRKRFVAYDKIIIHKMFILYNMRKIHEKREARRTMLPVGVAVLLNEDHIPGDVGKSFGTTHGHSDFFTIGKDVLRNKFGQLD